MLVWSLTSKDNWNRPDIRIQYVMEKLSNIISFPHPVNEVAARWVAFMVFSLSLAIILSNAYWMIWFLCYGFLARVLTGPKVSPMGLLATRVIVPTFGNRRKMVAGPPKRFAQAIGLVFSVASLLLVYAADMTYSAEAVLGVLAIFAAMESFAGFCAGCFVFGILMKAGIIPGETCKKCADIWSAA